MFKFFRSIDDFLTACEEYIEQRVWNGKFVYDLKFISATQIENAKDSYKKHKKKVQASPKYKSFVTFIKHYWGILMRIPMFSDTVWILVDGVRLCVKYVAHYLVVLITGLITTFWLLSAFQKSPSLFCILLVPLLLANHLFLSGFFYLIERREKDGHISISETIKQFRQNLLGNIFLFLLQFSVTVALGTFLLGFSSLLSIFFGKLHIDWTNSFFYWMPVVMLGLLLLIMLYFATILLAFSYCFIVIDKKQTRQAINLSWHYLQNDPKHSAAFYFLLTIAAFLYVLSTSLNSYEGGFAVSMFFSSQAFLFLGFLLRRRYYSKDIVPTFNIFETFRPPLKPLVAIGVLSYISFATFVIQVQPSVMKALAEKRQIVIVKYDLKPYINKDSEYVIDYPKSWSFYRWSNHSVTFYTNSTGTDVGGVKIDIDVHPESGSNYLELYESKPGLVIYDTATKDVTTKIANISIQGENAVKYTYTKIDGAHTEYQTHFLVHHNTQVYDISFVTNSKKSEEDYKEIFTQVIKSFQFTEPKKK
jgi:hypothetical protein